VLYARNHLQGLLAKKKNAHQLPEDFYGDDVQIYSAESSILRGAEQGQFAGMPDQGPDWIVRGATLRAAVAIPRSKDLRAVRG